MRHEAIRLLYSNAVTIDDAAGVFDSDGNEVLIDKSLVNTKLAELQAAEPLRLVRQQRNQLLAETDWRMVSDYPSSNQPEWQTYRQALRDITTQTPSLDVDGNLTGITWPTPPND